MSISVYSILMGIIWSSLGIVVSAVLRRRNSFVQNYGIAFLLAIYAGCILRMLIPIDFQIAKIIPSTNLFTQIRNLLNTQIFRIDNIGSFTIGSSLIVVYFMVVFALFLRVAISNVLFFKKLSYVKSAHGERVDKIVNDLCEEMVLKPIKIVQSGNIAVPQMAGYFSPIILLPDYSYTGEE